MSAKFISLLLLVTIAVVMCSRADAHGTKHVCHGHGTMLVHCH